MSAYRQALKHKKFEGLKVQEEPLDQEIMDQAASAGDYAPEISDDPNMAMPTEVAQLGEMDSEQPPISDEESMQFVDQAQATPGIEDLTSEEVFGVAAPEGRPAGLRERVMQSLKKRKQ